MKDQFVTYEIAKRLKELGFNEQCLGSYANGNFHYAHAPERGGELNSDRDHSNDHLAAAPLWQQAFDWLRSWDIHILIRPVNEIHPTPQFLGYKDGFNENEYHATCEQAREAAIIAALKLTKDRAPIAQH